MKIINLDNDRTIIQFQPYSTWLISSIVLLFGLVLVVIIGHYSELTCTRSSAGIGNCILNKRNLITGEAKTIPLNQLAAADLETCRGSKGALVYRIRLVVAGAFVPFCDSATSGYRDKQNSVDRINSFITNTGEVSLRVVQDDRPIAVFIGFIIVSIGAGIFVFFRQVTLFIDRATNKITIIRKNLIDKKSEMYQLSNIDCAKVDEKRYIRGNKGYRLILSMKDGRKIPLSDFYSNGYKDKQKLANKLNSLPGMNSGDYNPVRPRLF